MTCDFNTFERSFYPFPHVLLHVFIVFVVDYAWFGILRLFQAPDYFGSTLER